MKSLLMIKRINKRYNQLRDLILPISRDYPSISFRITHPDAKHALFHIQVMVEKTQKELLLMIIPQRFNLETLKDAIVDQLRDYKNI